MDSCLVGDQNELQLIRSKYFRSSSLKEELKSRAEEIDAVGALSCVEVMRNATTRCEKQLDQEREILIEIFVL